jgi:hypothetical protein
MSSVLVSASYIDDMIGVRILPHKAVETEIKIVHLLLIIDTSGSMYSTIEKVKKLCHSLIDYMNLKHFISIITFNSSASIPLNKMEMTEDRTLSHAAVESIAATGQTNFQAALLAIPSLTSPPTDVFLLTDGEVTEGDLRTPSEITNMLIALLPVGTPVHTVGIDHHDREMLFRISLNTYGSYCCASNHLELEESLGNTLGASKAEVGRDTRLILPPGYKSLELNYKEGASFVSVGRLLDEKPHWIILQKQVAAPAPAAAAAAAAAPAAAAAAAAAPAAAAAAAEISVPAEIEFHWKDESDHVEKVAVIPAEDSLLLTEQILRAITAKTLSVVTNLINRYDLDTAKTQLEELKAKLDGSLVATRLLIIQLRAQVDGMLEDMPSSLSGHPPPPSALTRMLSSGTSAAAYAGNQAGILSGNGRSPSGAVFSTPRQQADMRALSSTAGDPDSE